MESTIPRAANRGQQKEAGNSKLIRLSLDETFLPFILFLAGAKDKVHISDTSASSSSSSSSSSPECVDADTQTLPEEEGEFLAILYVKGKWLHERGGECAR